MLLYTILNILLDILFIFYFIQMIVLYNYPNCLPNASTCYMDHMVKMEIITDIAFFLTLIIIIRVFIYAK